MSSNLLQGGKMLVIKFTNPWSKIKVLMKETQLDPISSNLAHE